jgi:hypothetical protein
MVLPNIVLALAPEQLLSPASGLATFVMLYVGPDQILPLASALGAILGVLLIVWHQAVGLVHKLWHSVTRKRTSPGLKGAVPRVAVEPDCSIGERKVDQAS